MRQDTAFAARLYEVLLHVFPSEFRQAYGDVMTCVFEESIGDAYAKSGSAGVLKLWLHTITDLTTAAVGEWASRLMFSVGIEQRTSIGATIAIHAIVLFSLILMGISAGGLHPRPATTPACGKVNISHSSSTPQR